MNVKDSLPERKVHAWVPMGLVLAMGCTGVLMAHAPMIFSGFRRLQTDLGDSRYIHYMLEHGYRSLVGETQHRSFWNPPFFYPAQNVAAHSPTCFWDSGRCTGSCGGRELRRTCPSGFGWWRSPRSTSWRGYCSSGRGWD